MSYDVLDIIVMRLDRIDRSNKSHRIFFLFQKSHFVSFLRCKHCSRWWASMRCKRTSIWRIEFCNDPVVKKPNIFVVKQKSWCYLLNTHFSVVCIIFEMSSLSANLLMYFFAPVCFCYFYVRADIEIYLLWLWWTLPSKAYTVSMMKKLASWWLDSQWHWESSCHDANFFIIDSTGGCHYPVQPVTKVGSMTALNSYQWVVIMTTLSSLEASEVGIMTTMGVAINDKVGIMTTLRFLCIWIVISFIASTRMQGDFLGYIQ